MSTEQSFHAAAVCFGLAALALAVQLTVCCVDWPALRSTGAVRIVLVEVWR